MIGLLTNVFSRFAQLLERFGADPTDDLAHFDDQAIIDFLQRRPTADHQISNGYREFAGDGGHRQVNAALARQ
jgi:hypothetical protein